MKAIIASETSIYTYDTLVLDASGSTGEIKGYKWELISYSYDTIQVDSSNYDKPIESYTPWIDERADSFYYDTNLDLLLKEDYAHVYKPLIGEQYDHPIYSNTDSLISLIPNFPDVYEFKLTVVNQSNDTTTQHLIEVIPICNKSYGSSNLLTELFETTNNWLFDSTEYKDICDYKEWSYAGNIDFGNGYLEIRSGTDRDQYYAVRDLTELGINKNDKLMFRVSIAGPFKGPYWHDEDPTGFINKLSNGNVQINLFGKSLKIRMYTYFEAFRLGRRYNFSNKEISTYTWFDNDELHYYVCSDGLDVSREFEIVESTSEDLYIKIASGNYNDYCWLEEHTTTINALEIDRLN